MGTYQYAKYTNMGTYLLTIYMYPYYN